MRRLGRVMLPSVHLLNYGSRGTLKTNNIDRRGLPLSFSTLSPAVCRVEISTKHKVSFNVRKILSDRSHVLYLPTLKRYQPVLEGRYDEHQEGLWMNFISNSMQKKGVVRSWARRRIDQAVTGALRMRGFDRNGRRLVESNANTIKRPESHIGRLDLAAEHTPEVLIGTVEVHTLPASIETSFSEVQRQAEGVADRIMKTCGRYPCRE